MPDGKRKFQFLLLNLLLITAASGAACFGYRWCSENQRQAAYKKSQEWSGNNRDTLVISRHRFLAADVRELNGYEFRKLNLESCDFAFGTFQLLDFDLKNKIIYLPRDGISVEDFVNKWGSEISTVNIGAFGTYFYRANSGCLVVYWNASEVADCLNQLPNIDTISIFKHDPSYFEIIERRQLGITLGLFDPIFGRPSQKQYDFIESTPSLVGFYSHYNWSKIRFTPEHQLEIVELWGCGAGEAGESAQSFVRKSES